MNEKLEDKVRKIAREMCVDLDYDPDEYVRLGSGYRKRWQFYKLMVRRQLERDAYLRAKDKYDRKKL